MGYDVFSMWLRGNTQHNPSVPSFPSVRLSVNQATAGAITSVLITGQLEGIGMWTLYELCRKLRAFLWGGHTL